MKRTPFERFSIEQVEALEKSLNPKRVRRIGNEEYLPIKDVNAKLNEMFGFGGWSREIIVFEQILGETREHSRPGDNRKPRTRHDVGYLCHVRVKIHTADGDIVRDGLGYVDSATYAPNLPNHQTAALGAVSAATKSALKTLGNQFGLTLGNPDDPYGEARAAYDAWRHEQHAMAANPEPAPQPQPTPEETEAKQERLSRKVRELVAVPKEEPDKAEGEAVESSPEPDVPDDIPDDILSSKGIDREEHVSAVEGYLGEAWQAAQKTITDPAERRDPEKMLPAACRSDRLVSSDGEHVSISGPADVRRLADPSLYWLGMAMEKYLGEL